MVKIYGFEEGDAKRIKASVLRHEDYYRNQSPKGARWPVAGGSGGLTPAKTPGTTVGAGSTSSPTSFTATLYVLNGAGPGFTTSSTVTAYNPYTSTIPPNSLIWLTSAFGNWYVAAANC